MSHSRRIWLFGALRVADHEHPLLVSGSRVASLLVYLVLHPHTLHPREALTELLSPDAPPERARRNFSDALYRLRQTLGPDWLGVDADRVGLRPDDALWVDVWEFERLAAQGERGLGASSRTRPAQNLSRDDVSSLEQAAALYTGDLLPEIYDDWILLPRLALQEKYFALLETCAAALETQNDLPRALSYARQLITVDPLRESGHQTYLRLLGRLNRRAQAFAHYDYVRQLFQSELGVEPLAETGALVEAMRREAETAPSVSPLLEQTRFVGRVFERGLGVERIEQVMVRRGGLLCIEGEAGMGKSRLLRELASSARWRGAATTFGRASEYPDATPFSPLAAALEPLVRGARAAHLQNLLPAETLAALTLFHEPWRNLAALPELPPEAARQRFHQHFVTLMQTLAQFAPLVLMLDDMHWADEALWDLLDALTSHLSACPLLLFLAYRRPGIEKNPGWKFLQCWERGGYLQPVRLDPLNAPDVAQLLPEAERADAARVVALTAGNPFYVGEYLSRRDPFETRIAALSESARATLKAAAALGDQVPFRVWAMVTGESPLALAAASEELTAKYLLQPTETGYAFTHDVIHTAVYELIEPAQRQSLHARAARALAALEPENLRARAFQSDRAGANAQAAALYRQVGAQAMAQFAFREAQHALERALALTPAGANKERMSLLLELIRAYDVTGDREPQARAIDDALQHLDALRDSTAQTRVLLAAGDLATKTGQHEKASAFLNDALARARRAANLEQQAEILIQLGDLQVRTGDVHAAKQNYGQGLDLARQCGSRVQEALGLDGLGFVLPAVGGSPEQAERYLLEALQVRRASGDRFGEARSLANLLAFLQTSGAFDRVMELSEQALAANEAIGYRLGAAVVRAAQGLAACALGDFDTARSLISAAVEPLRSMADLDGVAVYTTSLGQVAEREGKLEEAEAHFETALALAQSHGALLYAALAQQDLGALRIRQERSAEAVPMLERARALFEENGDLPNLWRSHALLGLAVLNSGAHARAARLADEAWRDFQTRAPGGEDPQYGLWALYRLLDGLGRGDDAGRVLSAAFAVLQRQARILHDDQMRRRFFERVPVNRAISAAYFDMFGRARTQTVALARKTAPLGRTLAREERVEVVWTVAAPEDETFDAKTARRRYRLCRLLAEAQAQNAAPTDDDLARALGVSRHTILRDMRALAQTEQAATTRRRKMKRHQ
ncbi:MAG: AAA family ATPase [Anaerolineae bacterium]|nr:AAA family ATPase [Anaerolineae bacterium]